MKAITALLFCIVLINADEKQYRVMHDGKDGQKIVREITLNKEKAYARIQQLLRSEESNGQYYDFETGYVAERSKTCIVAKSRYTMDDMEEFVVGQVTNNERRHPVFDIGKEGTPIDDVATYAGKRISRYCSTLKAYKAVPKRMLRGKNCWWGWLCQPW